MRIRHFSTLLLAVFLIIRHTSQITNPHWEITLVSMVGYLLLLTFIGVRMFQKLLPIAFFGLMTLSISSEVASRFFAVPQILFVSLLCDFVMVIWSCSFGLKKVDQ